MNTTSGPTELKLHPPESGRWYTKDGKPVYEVPKADGIGVRPATLADARKLGLLPSVTSILRIKASEGLMQWRIREVAMALETSPRIDGESADDRINRILNEDREQDQSARRSADLGTEIHKNIEMAIRGQPYSLNEFVDPVIEEVRKMGSLITALTEKVVIGNGYAGKLDVVVSSPKQHTVIDFKTTRSMPTKGKARSEHRLQLGAYCGALHPVMKPLASCNIYISTQHPGDIGVCHNIDWMHDYEVFQCLFSVWKYENQFYV